MEISQKAGQKVMKNRREKIRKFEDRPRRFNSQIAGVPKGGSRENREEKSSMK